MPSSAAPTDFWRRASARSPPRFPMSSQERPTLAAKATLTGNPVRAAVVAAAASPYPALDDPLRLLVFGGSQGARVMADIVPAAIGRLDAGLAGAACRSFSRRATKTWPAFVTPMPSSLSPRKSRRSSPICRRAWRRAIVIVSRSGASTVAELAAIGRPSILVPLPHAIDQDQFANAGVLERAGGALRLAQDAFHPASGLPPRSPRSPPPRNSSPQWRRRPDPWAGSTPPTGLPSWC